MADAFFSISRAQGGETTDAARRFLAALAKASGTSLALRMVGSYDELFAALLEKGAMLAWLPPLLYSRSAVEGLVLAGVPERKGSLTFRSAILKRAGAPPHSLDSILGARVAWTDRSSASGYVFPRQHLLSAGALLANESFFGSTAEAAREVAAGRADLCACGVSAATLTVAASALSDALGSDAEGLEVLALTEPIPPDGFALSKGTAEPLRSALLAGLLQLHQSPEGSAALRDLLRADRIISAVDASIRLLRARSG